MTSTVKFTYDRKQIKNIKEGKGGCRRFWNLPICWSSSLRNRDPRFSFGMTREMVKRFRQEIAVLFAVAVVKGSAVVSL